MSAKLFDEDVAEGTSPTPAPAADWSGCAPAALMCISCLDMLGTLSFPDELLINVQEDTGDD